MKQPIYLDNAATSFPKPPQVSEAMIHYMNEVGANPGRSGHQLSLEASRVVQHTRDNLATLFNISDTKRIVFTMNVTEALNTVIYGFLNAGDNVIISAYALYQAAFIALVRNKHFIRYYTKKIADFYPFEFAAIYRHQLFF